jgi:hypothetical protein
MSFDWLRKSVSTLTKPISRVNVVKDALALSIKATQAVDRATGLTDKLGKVAFDKLGPARPGLINAADAVARSRVTAVAVKVATSGGPLTKAFNVGQQLGKSLDNKFGISDKVARSLPLPGSRAAPKFKVKATAPSTQGGRGGRIADKPVAPRSAKAASNLKIPHLKLKLPRLGQSLPKIRAQQNRAGAMSSPASRAAWSAAHMKMRTAKPTAAQAFSAKHMKIRSASSPARMTLRQSSFKLSPTRSTQMKRVTSVSRPAPIRSSPPPMRRSAPPMRTGGPAMRGFRR